MESRSSPASSFSHHLATSNAFGIRFQPSAHQRSLSLVRGQARYRTISRATDVKANATRSVVRSLSDIDDGGAKPFDLRAQWSIFLIKHAQNPKQTEPCSSSTRTMRPRLWTMRWQSAYRVVNTGRPKFSKTADSARIRLAVAVCAAMMTASSRLIPGGISTWMRAASAGVSPPRPSWGRTRL